MVGVGENRVLPFHQLFKVLFQRFGVQKVAHLDRFLHIFIPVHRRDAALGGTIARLAQPLLFQRVLQRMEGQHHDRPVGNFEIVRRDGHALLAQVRDFPIDVLEIDHRARAQQVHCLGAEDAGGNQVELALAEFIDHRMPRVVAALVAHHHIVLFRQEIDHAALSLVAPVHSNDCASRHHSIPHFRSCAGKNLPPVLRVIRCFSL